MKINIILNTEKHQYDTTVAACIGYFALCSSCVQTLSTMASQLYTYSSSPVQLQQQQFLEVTVRQSVSSWIGNKSNTKQALYCHRLW